MGAFFISVTLENYFRQLLLNSSEKVVKMKIQDPINNMFHRYTISCFRVLEEGADPAYLSNGPKVPAPLETTHKNVNSEIRKTPEVRSNSASQTR